MMNDEQEQDIVQMKYELDGRLVMRRYAIRNKKRNKEIERWRMGSIVGCVSLSSDQWMEDEIWFAGCVSLSS